MMKQGMVDYIESNWGICFEKCFQMGLHVGMLNVKMNKKLSTGRKSSRYMFGKQGFGDSLDWKLRGVKKC